MWTQVVGKVALAQAPPLNHSWAIALQVTPRGLTTRTLPHGDRIVHHRVRLHRPPAGDRDVRRRRRGRCRSGRGPSPTSTRGDGDARRDGAAGEDLADAGRDPVADPVRAGHGASRPTIPAYANRCWRILVAGRARVHASRRCAFIGKCSPVHFFWGGFDLAVTRFSGTAGAAARGPGVHARGVLARSDQPRILAGQRPAARSRRSTRTPCRSRPGLKDGARAARRPRTITASSASSSCRTRRCARPPIPTTAIAAFVDSTYDQAATLAGWDRAALGIDS